MTAHDTNLPRTPADPGATTSVGVTRVSRDRTGDKAAVIVWRITTATADDPDATAAPDAGGSPLTSRLARHLVAIYSDMHGTVIDFDADVNLRHAAETTGRHYLAVTDPASLTASADQPRPAALIMLRWPPATTAPGHDANSLLSACQQHLADGGSTIVVVTAATAGAAGTSYSGHEQVLLPAAQAAGLRHLHDIVPLDADDGRDVFTYATTRDTTVTSRDSDPDNPRKITNTTLVVFGQPGSRP